MNPFLKILKLGNIEFWSGVFTMILGWMITFVMPVMNFLVIVFFLVSCDLFTGIRAAKHKKDKITSRGLKQTVYKITLYVLAILLTKGMQDVFMIPFPLTYIVAFIIAVTEFKSNIENIEVVTGVKIWEVIGKKLTKLINPNNEKD